MIARKILALVIAIPIGTAVSAEPTLPRELGRIALGASLPDIVLYAKPRPAPGMGLDSYPAPAVAREMWRSIAPEIDNKGIGASIDTFGGLVMRVEFSIDGFYSSTVIAALRSRYGKPQRKLIPGSESCDAWVVWTWKDKASTLLVKAHTEEMQKAMSKADQRIEVLLRHNNLTRAARRAKMYPQLAHDECAHQGIDW
jgi:hypothetical protein